jgi:hypothetical protein
MAALWHIRRVGCCAAVNGTAACEKSNGTACVSRHTEVQVPYLLQHNMDRTLGMRRRERWQCIAPGLFYEQDTGTTCTNHTHRHIQGSMQHSCEVTPIGVSLAYLQTSMQTNHIFVPVAVCAAFLQVPGVLWVSVSGHAASSCVAL